MKLTLTYLEKQFNYYHYQNNTVTNLANISAICFQEFQNLNWIGFYLYDEQSNSLILGPFQGRAAVSTIKINEGVCGQVASKQKTIVVDDVHNFDGHIACDLNSKSELVVPIFTKNGNLYGVLDIDSPIINRFTSDDVALFESVVKYIEKII